MVIRGPMSAGDGRLVPASACQSLSAALATASANALLTAGSCAPARAAGRSHRQLPLPSWPVSIRTSVGPAFAHGCHDLGELCVEGVKLLTAELSLVEGGVG